MARRWQGPYRGGTVHVLAERCSTCVFRPGNLMRLQTGRLKELVDVNVEADSALTCHQTLEEAGHDVDGAVCRGFFDAHKTTPLQVAERLSMITEDPAP